MQKISQQHTQQNTTTGTAGGQYQTNNPTRQTIRPDKLSASITPPKQSPQRPFNPSINGSTRCVNSTPASRQKHFQSHSRMTLTAPDTDPEDQTGCNGNTPQLRNDRTPDTAGKIGHEVRSRPAILPPYRNFNPLRCRNPTQPECCPSHQTICPKGSERCVP